MNIEGNAADSERASITIQELTVRDFWKRIWLDGNLDALDELIGDSIVRHTAEGTQVLTRADLRNRLSAGLSAIRANEVNIDALAVAGDTVWAMITLRGVSLAAMAPLCVVWLAHHRIKSGRIAEIWALHQTGTDWSQQNSTT